MLAIKKRHNAVKAISAGSIAFVIGLVGVTAAVGDNFQPDNPVFNKEQTTEPIKEPVPVADSPASSGDQGSEADSTSASGSTQATGSSWSTSAPASSMTTTPSSSAVQAPVSPTMTAPAAPDSPTTPLPVPGSPAPTGTGTTPTGSDEGTTTDPACTTLCVTIRTQPLPDVGL